MITIKGLRSLKNKMAELEKMPKEVAQYTEAVSSEIALDARNKAPKDLGNLQRSIIYFPNSEKTGFVVQAGMPYAPYVEFGTGGLVSVPTELKDIAIKFKGKGVKQINLRPRPYLYPAFQKGRLQLLQDLERLIKNKVR